MVAIVCAHRVARVGAETSVSVNLPPPPPRDGYMESRGYSHGYRHCTALATDNPVYRHCLGVATGELHKLACYRTATAWLHAVKRLQEFYRRSVGYRRSGFCCVSYKLLIVLAFGSTQRSDGGPRVSLFSTFVPPLIVRGACPWTRAVNRIASECRAPAAAECEVLVTDKPSSSRSLPLRRAAAWAFSQLFRSGTVLDSRVALGLWPFTLGALRDNAFVSPPGQNS